MSKYSFKIPIASAFCRSPFGRGDLRLEPEKGAKAKALTFLARKLIFEIENTFSASVNSINGPERMNYSRPRSLELLSKILDRQIAIVTSSYQDIFIHRENPPSRALA